MSTTCSCCQIPQNHSEKKIFTRVFAINTILALAFLFGGAMLGFSPLIGEGWHQLEDSFLKLLALLAVNAVVQNSLRPSEKGKDNLIWTLIASVLLIVFEGHLFIDSLSSLTTKGTGVNFWTVFIIITGIVANFICGNITKKSHTHIGKFSTLHDFLDGGLGIFSLIVVFLMLTGFTQWHGLNVQHLATLVIAGAIIAFGVQQAKETRTKLKVPDQLIEINHISSVRKEGEHIHNSHEHHTHESKNTWGYILPALIRLYVIIPLVQKELAIRKFLLKKIEERQSLQIVSAKIVDSSESNDNGSLENELINNNSSFIPITPETRNPESLKGVDEKNSGLHNHKENAPSDTDSSSVHTVTNEKGGSPNRKIKIIDVKTGNFPVGHIKSLNILDNNGLVDQIWFKREPDGIHFLASQDSESCTCHSR